MIDTPPPQPLNSYNVAQLQYALSEDGKTPGIDSLTSDVHVVDYLSLSASPALVSVHPPFTLPPMCSPLYSHAQEQELDYASRRMSSSATSDSSLQSRPEKHALSPSNSPLPKKVPISALPRTSADARHQPSLDHEERADIDGARVQLPSIASAFQDRPDLRRASLPALYPDNASRVRLPHPTHRPTQSSGFVDYQFPTPDDKFATRPRLPADTQLGLYNPVGDYATLPSTQVPQSGNTSFGFHPGDYPRSSGLPSSYSSESDSWASGIIRPNSTPSNVAGAPGSGLKYDETLRHSSLGGPVCQQQLYGGVTRISGQHGGATDRGTRQSGTVKNESEQWNFPSNDFSMASPSSYPPTPSTSAAGMAPSSSAPSIPVSSSPSRSPQTPASASSTLVERPPRKRGKLPKPVTDFLKDWLHRHSDHPYPSEEEKKQLCNATGLSMSQVSNWMINARRRILAPAHRAAAGPTTTTPFSSRPGGAQGPSSVLDSGRRASMPTDSLQLYYPMSLQSLGDPHLPSSTRQMVSMTRSMSSSHATAGNLSAAGHHGHGGSPYALDAPYSGARMGYGSGAGAGASLHPSGSGYLGMALNAPPPPSFLGSQAHGSMYAQGHASQGAYMHSPQSGGRMLTPQDDAQGQPQSRYTFPDHSASPQPGSSSGYATPQ
ncbi:uncharacterized protein LAESUDRAFT_733964 [Laetiporus sulphureus 93-53]|uniref:Homeobox domain-containing protein n=1 Tax=Laetiporus sulphureus 93-53 TaxID=1314785 RepID=A0A165HSN0_9APHY|nr:uncharacterized protein LAESUDRAFT_733964 [Laetiporus sulphureus 93-53]KZT12132.1 hypothetical protein LAESUDRAFT_733964 [Laetiporus sulphureus 93-53]